MSDQLYRRISSDGEMSDQLYRRIGSDGETRTSQYVPVKQYVPVNEPLICDKCGGLRVWIRGRHVGDSDELVCPTCLRNRICDALDECREVHDDG